MPTECFQLFGSMVPKMIGRDKVVSRLVKDLTKKAPSHLSVVGPCYAGKTVILNALAERMKANGSPYYVVVLWDLAHQTPRSDKTFVIELCKKIGTELGKIDGDSYGQMLISENGAEYADLRDVVEALDDEGSKILLLLDGFDKLLKEGDISRNVWDQLRELSSCDSLRIVTATRKNLQQLIRSEESITSDFWNIFDINPVKVDLFDEDDKRAVLDQIRDLELLPGAKSELDNWTGGYPPLYLAVLNRIIEGGGSQPVDNNVVNEMALDSLDVISNLLEDLWNDCSETAKNAYLFLLEGEEQPISELSHPDKTSLMEKGFVKMSSRGKIEPGCRFLINHCKLHASDHGSFKRLLGSSDNYMINIRKVLELRLNQVESFDERLSNLIRQCIKEIPNDSESCLRNLRGILDRALKLIWVLEFGEDRIIPAEYVSYWEERSQYIGDRVPIERGKQCRLLKLITGSENNLIPKAKYVSKNVYAQVNALQRFADFGQHIDESAVHEGTAIASVMCAIELAACLSLELKSM